ncbi:hypothetical protein COCCADRAFT_33794 [Bipolaris zeicola 26-R-13]|uniref:Uncharacterized protein n=1 Tax=Cochliobolus carbonum (strain 26-R-13) TaxID=930089 RepID=W6YZY7_COCC2|nr:uncharacterized protein COCCADRAFT_33794 [Bipolaris zeicola 26-R-13]EUC36976.1 hypothetical protein COCCADRAFT_33794 [Bipolaris zeicola 26-R-13]
MYSHSYYCCYPSIANDSQAVSLRATLNGDPPVPGFLGVGLLSPNPRCERARVLPSGPRHPSLDRHYSSLTHLHGVGTYARSLTERYSVTACYHVSSHQGLPPGLAVNYLRRPAPQQKPAWTKRSQRRRAVRRGSRWLHASKARGVRGDPGCATIEMGSIGRSTAAVRPFRLASAAALARPPTSPPQLTAPKARQLLQCISSFPMAALLRYIWSLAPTHAALIGQNRPRT